MRKKRDETSSSQGYPGTRPTIPDLDARVWLPAAQAIGDVVCDAGFYVEGRLTALGETDASGRRELVLLAGVQPPGLPQRVSNYVVTSDIVGHTAELAAYYQRSFLIATFNPSSLCGFA